MNYRKLVLCSLICFPLLSFAQLEHAVRTDYFAGLPFWESPIRPFRGEYPLSKEETSDKIHLRLEYDSKNRIVEASVRIGEELKEFEGFFGNLYINAPQTKVSYQENVEVHRFFDRFGNRIKVMGSVWEKIYTKDKYGRNIRLQFKDKEDGYTDDNFGNVVYEWTHLMDGSVVEVRKNKEGKLTPLRGDFEFLRTKISFGPDGQVNALHNIDEQGTLVNAPCGAATLRYFYDAYGRFDRWEVYDKDGKSAKGPSHTNGEQNLFTSYYVTDIVFFNESGGPATHWSGVERWSMQYDRFGNVTQLNFLNANAKRKNANDGFASIRYEWSEDGRFLLSQSYLDEMGNLKEHPANGIATIIHTRLANGQMSESKYLGANGKPKSRKDTGAFVTTYRYSGKNELVEIILWDKEGNRKETKQIR